jgi:hypothetical protein
MGANFGSGSRSTRVYGRVSAGAASVPRNVTIENVSKKGIMALADLSDRETLKANLYSGKSICFDLQLI